MPEEIQTPPSLGVRSNYVVTSEMAVLNTDALMSEGMLNVSMLGNTYAISRESIETEASGDYTWIGSGEEVPRAIFVVENGTEASGLVYTITGTFEILHVTSDIHEIYELDMSRFHPTASSDVGAGLAAHRSPGQIGDDRISELEAAYMGWLDYDKQEVDTDPVDTRLRSDHRAGRERL